MATKKEKLEQAGLLDPNADPNKVDQMLDNLSHNDVDQLISLLGASNLTDAPWPVGVVPDPDPLTRSRDTGQSTAKSTGKSTGKKGK